jgi:hypothetical protein
MSEIVEVVALTEIIVEGTEVEAEVENANPEEAPSVHQSVEAEVLVENVKNVNLVEKFLNIVKLKKSLLRIPWKPNSLVVKRLSMISPKIRERSWLVSSP